MTDDHRRWLVGVLARLDQHVAEMEAIKFTATGEAINRAASKLFQLNHMRRVAEFGIHNDTDEESR